MGKDNKKKSDHSWLQRLNYAWEPLKSSLTIRIFGGVSLLACVEEVFKVREWAVDAKLVTEREVELAVLAYFVFLIFAIRSLFLVAEEAGIHREEIANLEKQAEAHGEVHRCLHSVIHETRDCLLAEGAFRRLLALDEQRHIQHLYDTVQRQLGMMEKAMRSLSGSDCSIVLKIIKEDPATHELKFMSCCYGPGTQLERRKQSTMLPLNQGIAYECYITKSICFTNDVAQDQRFWPQDLKEQYSKNRYQTVVVCPVITNKVVCGVLCFDWREKDMYCKEYEQILACFTDVVSLACYICHESRNVTVKT